MYKVFVYASKMPLPIQFTVHTWIVTEHDEVRDRFDVLGFKEDRGIRHGYFYKNFLPPKMGCPVFSIGKWRLFEKRITWKTELLYEIQGGVGSDAHKIYTLLHKDYKKIPIVNRFRLLIGPNCNSFTQWVLDYVAPKKYPLPLKAYGKGWHTKPIRS